MAISLADLFKIYVASPGNVPSIHSKNSQKQAVSVQKSSWRWQLRRWCFPHAWLVVPTRWSWFFFTMEVLRIIRTSFEVTAHFRKGVKFTPMNFFGNTNSLESKKKHLQFWPQRLTRFTWPQCHVKVKNLMVFPNWGGVRVCRWWKRTLQGTDRYLLLGKGKSSTQMCLFLGWIC